MSYLEGYGVREARSEKYLKYGILALVVVAITAILLYFLLRDRAERNQIQEFLDRLNARDYKSAYALWGCTDANPCRDYPLEKFLEDWGPSSPQASIASAKSDTARHCDTGILQILRFPDGHEVQLWVQRQNDVIGFAPWQVDTKAQRSETRFALRNFMRNVIGDCSDLR